MAVRFCGSSFAAALVATVVGLGIAAPPSHAASATVQMRVGNAGFIVGVGGGSGTLTFRGRTYRLRIGGISAGTIGISQAELVGRALHLRHAEDIAGTYSAVGAGLAIAGGGKTARLRNARGVVLELSGRQVGFAVSLNLSGVNISLEQ